MTPICNALLFLADAVLYFTVLTALFRARHRIGIGTFFCALGVMHFLETYLASVLYVQLPFGIVASPGSVVLFTGKLMLLLLVYIRDDAVVVRQPIYGLLIGNILLLGLGSLMRAHVAVALSSSHGADFALLDQMGWLMIWGTAVLFADCILIILLYEKLRGLLGGRVLPRLVCAGALVLSFDQVTFFLGLRMLTGAPLVVLAGGWIAKMCAVGIYSVLAGIYLRWLEPPRDDEQKAPRFSDVFDLLTYRERYEDLVARSGHDALTGALDRGRLESDGRRIIDRAVRAGRPASVLLIDIDHFKSFNDRYGHAAGDVVLKRIADNIGTAVRAADVVFRFGGEEFVVICDGVAGDTGLVLGERIRREIADHAADATPCVTVSIGVASCAADASDYNGLFAVADRRLYAAKAAGRNCVVGAPPPTPESSRHLTLVS
jgi:diguanylate cyclase (GGDEF)-like protein